MWRGEEIAAGQRQHQEEPCLCGPQPPQKNSVTRKVQSRTRRTANNPPAASYNKVRTYLFKNLQF